MKLVSRLWKIIKIFYTNKLISTAKPNEIRDAILSRHLPTLAFNHVTQWTTSSLFQYSYSLNKSFQPCMYTTK